MRGARAAGKAVSDPGWQAACHAWTSCYARCWWLLGCWRPRSAWPRASRGGLWSVFGSCGGVGGL